MQIKSIAQIEAYKAKYDYCARLNRRGWAYEHLRRNSVFCEQAWSAQQDAVSEKIACHSITLLKLRRAQPEAG